MIEEVIPLAAVLPYPHVGNEHRVSEAPVGDMPFLDRTRVAEMGGVKPGTVKQYQVDSKPGGRFEKDPFPEPDGRVNRGPWWRVEREQEIREWFGRIQDRAGVGGRPRKNPA